MPLIKLLATTSADVELKIRLEEDATEIPLVLSIVAVEPAPIEIAPAEIVVLPV